MSISLSGAPQPRPDCTKPPHHWDIVGTRKLNPRTGKAYGNNTPGTCRNCGQERMFNSEAIQHSKGELFSLTTHTD